MSLSSEMERRSEKLTFDNDVMFKGHKIVLLVFSLCEAAKVINSFFIFICEFLGYCFYV